MHRLPLIKVRLWEAFIKTMHLCVPKIKKTPNQLRRVGNQDIMAAVSPALTGSYPFEGGAYNLTGNFLHGKIDEDKGEGDPLEGKPYPRREKALRDPPCRKGGRLASFCSIL